MTAPFALPLVARGGAVCKREGWSVSDPVAVAVSHASDLAEARAEREARAAYIARAVNLHERLVEALTKAETFITDCEWSIADPDWDIRADGIVLELRELLREAEAE